LIAGSAVSDRSWTSAQTPNDSLNRKSARSRRDGKEALRIKAHFGAFLVHVILDDYLHTDSHVMERRDDEQQHEDCHRGRAEYLGDRRVIAPDQGNDNQHCRDGEWNIGYRGQPLPDAEVHGLERDDVAELEESGGLAACAMVAHSWRNSRHRNPPMDAPVSMVIAGTIRPTDWRGPSTPVRQHRSRARSPNQVTQSAGMWWISAQVAEKTMRPIKLEAAD
jgi:hypothetical protein